MTPWARRIRIHETATTGPALGRASIYPWRRLSVPTYVAGETRSPCWITRLIGQAPAVGGVFAERGRASPDRPTGYRSFHELIRDGLGC